MAQRAASYLSDAQRHCSKCGEVLGHTEVHVVGGWRELSAPRLYICQSELSAARLHDHMPVIMVCRYIKPSHAATLSMTFLFCTLCFLSFLKVLNCASMLSSLSKLSQICQILHPVSEPSKHSATSCMFCLFSLLFSKHAATSSMLSALSRPWQCSNLHHLFQKTKTNPIGSYVFLRSPLL